MADAAAESIPQTPSKLKSGISSAKGSAKKSLKSTPKSTKPEKMAPPVEALEQSEAETNGWNHSDEGEDEEEELAQTRSEAPELEDEGEEEAEDELEEGVTHDTPDGKEHLPGDAVDGGVADAAQGAEAVEGSVAETDSDSGAATETRTEQVNEPVAAADKPTDEIVEAGIVSENGEVVDDEGSVIGKVNDGDAATLAGSVVDVEGHVRGKDGEILGQAEPNEAGAAGSEDDVAPEKDVDASETKEKVTGNVSEDVSADKLQDEEAKQVDEGIAGIDSPPLDAEDKAVDSKDVVDKDTELSAANLQGPFKVNTDGTVLDAQEQEIGHLPEGIKAEDLEDQTIMSINDKGEMMGEDDVIVGNVDLLPLEELPLDKPEDAKDGTLGDVPDAVQGDEVDKLALAVDKLEGPFKVDDTGAVLDGMDEKVGDLASGVNVEDLDGKEITTINAEHELIGEDEEVLGKVDLLPVEELPLAPELPDLSILKGLKLNKLGKVVKDDKVIGELIEGDAKKLAGKEIDGEGQIWNNSGKVIGRVQTVPDLQEGNDGPFEDFPDAIVDKSGKVLFEGKQVGIVVEGDSKKLAGKHVDADGDILSKNGELLGRAERQDEEEPEEPEPEPEPEVDFSMLADKKVNKSGNICDSNGAIVGRVKEGVLKVLIGRKVDKNGEIWSDSGKVIGKAEPIPDNEREDAKESGPFEDFDGALVTKTGDVVYEGQVIGKLVDGDPKKLANKQVDSDGDVVDKAGNVLGKAERWEAEEAEPEPEVDMSALAGKRVNKLGKVCDSHGQIYGNVIEGDIRRLVGKMCDKQGCIRNEGGDVIGRAELVPEAEREGVKDSPFADFPGCTVAKDGKIKTPSGEVVGRLVSGDGKVLAGRTVDEDGEILDKNGNCLAKAERWEEEEVAKDISILSGLKVNKEGQVYDNNGELAGKLTDGTLSVCAGKTIDDENNVVDSKGTVLGHVSLIGDIPVEEVQESSEDKQKREEKENDDKLAAKMSSVIEQSLDKIRPILKMIRDVGIPNHGILAMLADNNRKSMLLSGLQRTSWTRRNSSSKSSHLLKRVVRF